MSQRNPMNERYTTDEKKGKTRKSAAKAKPKSRAASTVRVQSTQPTKREKKAKQKAERAKQQELDRKYYNPPTEEYKRWRKVWWALLIGGVVLIAVSWGIRFVLPSIETGSYVMLGLAYACVIGALILDFTKIRKTRRAYQEEMLAKKSKEERAAAKAQKAAERAAKEQAEESSEELPEKKNSIFAKLMGNSKNKQEASDTKESDSDSKGK